MKIKLLFALVLSFLCTINLNAQSDVTSAGIKVSTLKPGDGSRPEKGQEFYTHVDVSDPAAGNTIFSTRDMNVPFHGLIGEDTDKESIAIYDAMQKNMLEGGKYRLEVPKSLMNDQVLAGTLEGDYIVYEMEVIDFADAKPSATKEITAVLTSRGVDAAQDKFRELKDNDSYTLAEWDMNKAGYEMLKEGKTDEAIALFQMNTELNPGSWNAYDSLGDGYLAKKETEKARDSFEKALELNPDYRSSREKLDSLK